MATCVTGIPQASLSLSVSFSFYDSAHVCDMCVYLYTCSKCIMIDSYDDDDDDGSDGDDDDDDNDDDDDGDDDGGGDDGDGDDGDDGDDDQIVMIRS